MPDIDIDFLPSFNPNTIFKQAVPASMVKKDELVKHPCGQYFQDMPIDAVTGLAAIPYKEAEEIGYFKIDFLHLSLLEPITSKQEIRDLIKKPPKWDLLLDEKNVEKLFHISKHGDLLRIVRPRSVEELADCLALIRPAKRHLLNDYLKNKEKTRKLLYIKSDNDQYYFKKSHSIAYSLSIVVQLHLIEQGRL